MKRPGRVAATVEVHRQPYLQKMVSGDRDRHFFGTLHEGLWILDIASGIRKFFDSPLSTPHSLVNVLAQFVRLTLAPITI
jgi:hypothetical protein